MKDRGMKKWAAYKSLNEQTNFLERMMERKQKREKPQISESRAEEINEILVNYRGEKVAIRFFWNGNMKETRGTITSIDAIYNFLKINDIVIRFNEIVEVNKA